MQKAASCMLNADKVVKFGKSEVPDAVALLCWRRIVGPCGLGCRVQGFSVSLRCLGEKPLCDRIDVVHRIHQ